MQFLLIRYSLIIALMAIWALAVTLLPETLNADSFSRGVLRNLALVIPVFGLINAKSLGDMNFDRTSWLVLTAGWFISLIICTSTLTSTQPISIARWSNFVFISPFIEEVVFRGLILQKLLLLLSKAKAILLSSLLFSLMHLPQFLIFGYEPSSIISNLLFIFTLGLVLALLSVRFKRLWPAILAHTANNLYGFL